MQATHQLLPAGGAIVIAIVGGLALYLTLSPNWGSPIVPAPSNVIVTSGGFFNMVDFSVNHHNSVSVYGHPECYLPAYPEDYSPLSIDTFQGFLTLCGRRFDEIFSDTPAKTRSSCLQLNNGEWREVQYNVDIGMIAQRAWKTQEGLWLVGQDDENQSKCSLALANPGYTAGPQFLLVHDPFASCLITGNGKLVVTGGGNSGKFRAYAWVTQYSEDGLVTELPKLNTPRGFHACGSFMLRGHEVYIVAGGLKNMAFDRQLVSTEIFENEKWREGTPLEQPRAMLKGAVLDGKFFLSGGVDPSGNVFDEVFSLNPDTEAWEVEESLDSRRAFHAVNVLPYGDIQQYCGPGKSQT